MGVKVLVTRLDPDLPLPTYSKGGDAGADLVARVDVTLAPGERALVPTGISIALPNGYVALVHPRSGLAIKHGVTMVNAPGTVDSDYRGEMKVPLINLGRVAFIVEPNMRIAQMVIARVEHAQVSIVTELTETTRGEGGFGSTGVGHASF